MFHADKPFRLHPAGRYNVVMITAEAGQNINVGLFYLVTVEVEHFQLAGPQHCVHTDMQSTTQQETPSPGISSQQRNSYSRSSNLDRDSLVSYSAA